MANEITIPEGIDKNTRLIPMLIIGGLFFMFGFITWLNGSLIPFLQISCELDHIEAYFVTLVFYIAYTIMAIPSAVILKKTGYKHGMVIGLIIMTIGALLFIPAAQSKIYAIFLCALFVLGTGLTLLQTASNPYIVLIGPIETAAVRISIMGLLNKGAGVIAPIIFTAYVLTDMSQFNEARLALLDVSQRTIELQELSSRLINPYKIMALMLATLALLIYLSPLPEPDLSSPSNESDPTSTKKITHYPQLILGAITLFFYVGVEVIAGDTIGLYGKELGVENFGQLTSYTMAFMVLAYILGMLMIPKLIKQETALIGSAILGLTFTILAMTVAKESNVLWSYLFSYFVASPIPDTVLLIALLGFSNALVWPTVWPMALKNLGKHTATGSALLIMGISGGALLPILYGALVDYSQNAQFSYWIMLPCYGFILFYAVKGHKLVSW